MKNNSLWYLFSDLFYKYKCCNGFIDGSDKDYHSFQKKEKLFQFRRKGESIRFVLKDMKKFKDNNYIILKDMNYNNIQEALIGVEEVLK